MRIANVAGRLTLLPGDAELQGIDVERASEGRFSSDPAAGYERWAELREWAAGMDGVPAAPIDPAALEAPSPRPRQVFAIGANYRDHAAEAGIEAPKAMEVFTKYPSCIVGPYASVPLPSTSIDWEAELVLVIGRRGHHVPAEQAWDYVAGVTVGQDLTDRMVQLSASQFSLSKSFPAFGPTGPWLITPDRLADPDDLAIECTVNGERMQKARTSEMVYAVPAAIARISAICPLLPGDLIFTGTMGGVGYFRKPPQFLAAGDEVVTEIEGVGVLRNVCVQEESPTT